MRHLQRRLVPARRAHPGRLRPVPARRPRVVPFVALLVAAVFALLWIRAGTPLADRDLGFVITSVAVIAAGELVRLDLGGRVLAPVSTATAMGLVLAPLGAAGLGLTLAECIVLVTVALAVSAALRAATARGAGVPDLAARFLGVSSAAAVSRMDIGGTDLLTWWQDPAVPRWLAALALVSVATIGVAIEIGLWTLTRSRTWRISWTALARADFARSGYIGSIMTNAGALMAFAYPMIGSWVIPLFLWPIATALIALRRAQRIRGIQRQLVAALARLSDETGHTRHGHAQRVADLCLTLGEELGLGPADLLALRDAALIHDVGQVTLSEPIPDGATLNAAPAEQSRVVQETIRIVEEAGLPAPVVAAVRGSIVQFRMHRELGEQIPVTGRIIKVANAYDDLTRGRRSARSAALERIHLGLGYEYDPAVVDALARVTQAAPA